ncbi:START domain-containing protein [Candidatus Marimicrobium litorale]|uniref:START domain-containing protein n=1 Tax=Candidatus Marimicrobium litorale TaxID=2518991 RepID=A0ABT3T6E4_9GAMM|nr:START domain-containing protein [Candidatus Marimicrobium litorale]MCX2977057.1 hypothetical protein [Candidatus Marimicrobium litorale]
MPGALVQLTRRLLALALISIAVAASGAIEPDWELQDEDGTLQVFTREVDASPFLEVMARVQINAPLARITEFLGDGSGCAEWRAMCRSSQVLEEVSAEERYVYLVLDMPWPLTDRDMVIHSQTRLDPDSSSAIVNLRTDSSRHPPGDFVRAESVGQFILRVLPDQQVEFTYIMHTDLGGDLPPESVNARLAESAMNDLKRLKALAEG